MVPGHKGLYDTITHPALPARTCPCFARGDHQPGAQHIVCVAVLCVPSPRTTNNAKGSALHPHTRTSPSPDGRCFATCDLLFIRDYDPKPTRTMFWLGSLEHKEAIISHLAGYPCSSVSTLGLLRPQPTMWSWPSVTPEKQILVEAGPSAQFPFKPPVAVALTRMDVLPCRMPTAFASTAWPK